MLRFVLLRQEKDRMNQAEHSHYETLDVDAPELEAKLREGGRDQYGYSIRSLIGVELLEKE